MNFIWLVFAHYIGDYAFQSSWMAENKGKDWYVMLSHCMIWTACISMALQFSGVFILWKVGFLAIGHAVCDILKCTSPERKWLIYPDQMFHFLQCLFVYIY